MNVPAMVPWAVSGDAAASGDGAKQTATEGSRSVPDFLFPLLFNDLLQPEAGENLQIEKKAEKSFPDANPAAVIPLPVPLPMRAGFILGPIAGQISDAQNRASTDADLAPGAPLELSTNEAEATDANETPDPERILNQVAAASDLQSAGDGGEADVPAGFVPERIRADLTVPPRAPDASGLAPAIPRAPVQEIPPPSATGIAHRQESAAHASAIVEAADAPRRTLPVQNVATADGISSAVSAFASERVSGVRASRSLEMAGAKRASGVAVPPAPLEKAELGMEPPDKVALAFTVRLAPLDKATAPHLSAPPQGKSTGPLAEGLVPSVQPAEMDENSARPELPVPRPMIALRTAAHPGAGSAPDADPPVRNTESLALSNDTRLAEVPAASPARPPHVSPLAEPHGTVITTSPEPPPLWPAPAREIRLQVGGNEQRVDVRLTEHRGEVQVAVRTPDSRLTEVLRSDLPALSARLEQSGFRAETWHPAVSRTDHPLLSPQPSSSGLPQQGSGEGHGNSQDHEPPQRRAPLAEDHSDSPPPEFSWLLSSLR